MAKNLCGAMVSGATAPDSSFKGFTKPPKHPFPKGEKKICGATTAQIIFLD